MAWSSASRWCWPAGRREFPAALRPTGTGTLDVITEEGVAGFGEPGLRWRFPTKIQEATVAQRASLGCGLDRGDHGFTELIAAPGALVARYAGDLVGNAAA